MAQTQAQMEVELIERLKAKQKEQRKAYQQLEAVLSLGSRQVIFVMIAVSVTIHVH